MTLIDWVIVTVLAIAALVGLWQGFVRSVCALGGLVLGLEVAVWNYHRAAAFLLPVVRSQALANTLGFLLLAVAIMVATGLLGAMLAKAFHLLGLGWIDALAGAAFGFLQGVLLVTICILATLAFFPKAPWLAESTLSPLFFRACTVSTNMSPKQLAQHVRVDMSKLEKKAKPVWTGRQTGKQ